MILIVNGRKIFREFDERSKYMKSLSRTALLTFIVLLTSKLLGFFREILLAYKYGTSYINDAYAICTSLPAILFCLFASGVTQSYIPVYSRIENNRKKVFFSNAVTVLFVFSIIVAIICVVFNQQIVTILAPGFTERTKELAQLFIDIVAWHLPVYVIFNILCADAQAKESFLVVSFCDYIVVNIVLIIAIVLSSEEHLSIMAEGYVASMIIATLILAVYSKKRLNLKYQFTFKPFDKDFKILVTLAIPIGVSVMVNQLNSVTDRVFASMLGVGITSALEYANRLQSLFLTLTTTVFISVCFPRINKCFANKDMAGGVYYIKKAVLLTVLLAIPFMLVIIGYAESIVKILFERGAFDTESTRVTSECLIFYAIGIPFYAFREIETKALAANMKQRMILRNTVIAVVINIVLDLVLLESWGHAGLAFATSVAGIVCSLMMLKDLKELKIFEKEELLEILKILVIAIASHILGAFSYRMLPNLFANTTVIFIIAIMIFAVTYLLLCIVCKVKVAYWCLSTLTKRKE